MLISIKDLIKKGFSIWKARLVPFLAVGVVAVGLGHVIGSFTMTRWLNQLTAAVANANPGVEITAQNIRQLIQNVPIEQTGSFFFNPLLWLGLLLALLLSLWSQAALLVTNSLYDSATPATQARSLSKIATEAFKFMWPLFLIEVIFALAGLIVSLPAVIVSVLNLPLILVVISAIVLVGLVVSLAVRFAFAPLLLVVENLGVSASLKRSQELVKNRWLATAARMGVLFVISLPLMLILSRIPFGAQAGQIILAPFMLACAIALVESLKETYEQD